MLKPNGTYVLSDEQARAILELRLARLTQLGLDEITEELNKLAVEIKNLLEILSSRARVQAIIRAELAEIKNNFATPRRTAIENNEGEVDDEDLIQREDMVVTVFHAGYAKRVPLSAYRAQRRGGKGKTGAQVRDEDFVTKLFVANTHTPILFFSSIGMVYKLKVWRLPVGNPQARGKALINMLPLDQNERITTIMPMPEDETSWASLQMIFATDSGDIRRNEMADFESINRNGKIAMKLEEGDALIGVEACSDADDILLTTAQGQCIRFAATDVRVFQIFVAQPVCGDAHIAGTSAPPSSLIRAPKRSSAGSGEILPAIRPSPCRNVAERWIARAGTNENAAWAKAASAGGF